MGHLQWEITQYKAVHRAPSIKPLPNVLCQVNSAHFININLNQSTTPWVKKRHRTFVPNFSNRLNILDVDSSTANETQLQTIGCSRLPTLPTPDLTAILCNVSPIYSQHYKEVRITILRCTQKPAGLA